MAIHVRTISSSLLAISTALACALTATTRVRAQGVGAEHDSMVLGEIVVTAQKREESLQDVPISITALGGDDLTNRGIADISDLQVAVPGLQFQEQAGILLPFLRGVGNQSNTIGNEASVATYVDGVYFARMPASMFELSNLQRVEILKGPQGTLFGRNSTGGVINIITKDPSHQGAARSSVGFGRFDALNANLYATTGLSEAAAMDLAISGSTDDGFGRNTTTGNRYGFSDQFLVRSKLLVEPTDSAQLRLSGFYSSSKQSGQKTAYPGTSTGTISAPNQVFTSEAIGYYNAIDSNDVQHTFKTWGAALRYDQELSFARFASISAFSKLDEFDAFDGDKTPRPDFYVPIKGDVKLFTQEFQLSNPVESQWDWILGVYYYNNHSRYSSVQFLAPLLFGPGVEAPAHQTSLSYAGFAQATYEVVPHLRLTGGVRYTSDDTSAYGELNLRTTPPIPLSTVAAGSTKINRVTFKVAADYEITDHSLAYASFSRGFKSGNYNLLTYNSDTPTKPEGLDAYEVGMKNDFFNRRVRLNAAAFYYDINSPQVQLVKNTTVFFTNAGSSRVKGVEIDGQAVLFAGFVARLNGQYLDSKYVEYNNAPTSTPDLVNGGAIPLPDIDAKGNRTPLAAKWTGGIGADYEVKTSKGSVTFTADYYRNSGFFFEPDNLLHQGSFGLLNGQIKYAPTDKLAVRCWGKNLTDTEHAVSASTQLGSAGYQWTPAPPRTYGVAIDLEF